MEAVLLAGGFGTRLRPLTYTRPKPLLPILNKPMIRRFIERLPEEVNKIIIPLNYLREMVENFFETVDLKKEIIITEEKEPLGTGGAVKNVDKYISSSFLVLNVDVISSINLSDFIKFHRAKKGIGTISAWPVENPEEFGIMELNSNKKITRFQEKPKREEAFSKLINAGAYALEYEILSHIPSGKFVSMEREIFPKVLDRNMYGYEFKGHWLDTGRPVDYINAHKILLENIERDIGKSTIYKNTNISSHVMIGKSCVIDGVVKPYSCLGDNIITGKNSEISESVIMNDVKIGPDTKILHSIIGEKCIIGKNVHLKNVVLGDRCVIHDNISLLDAKTDPNEER